MIKSMKKWQWNERTFIFSLLIPILPFKLHVNVGKNLDSYLKKKEIVTLEKIVATTSNEFFFYFWKTESVPSFTQSPSFLEIES